jgi:hypothetical protein
MQTPERTDGFNFVDLILVDEEVEERVEVVEEHDDFRRLNPRADGCEPDDVAEQHRHGREHLARVQSTFASSVFANVNVIVNLIVIIDVSVYVITN